MTGDDAVGRAIRGRIEGDPHSFKRGPGRVVEGEDVAFHL